ncbi:hypothetical protein SAMN05444339_101121 [Loktanella atrilutea]|uniref:Uncharacterized protein n=1 Tax=Loktanella atrilutea TaxID=366533 RepID=A0A1M4SSA6_LOKAT|nr:hypothetical protein [Loktanella atrilutea]SHE35079.1 hypothetical protein SAMN05444339_101121 [Loktanella atrilutea]
MSDPMTNVEIEDVLSSIRRLVADGSQPAAPRPTPPRTPKLVLTPALRVDTPVEGQTAEEPQAPAEAAPIVLGQRDRIARSVRVRAATEAPAAPTPIDEPAAKVPDRLSLLATIAELEAAVREQADEWEPDGTGTQTDPGWARAVFRGPTGVGDDDSLDDDFDPAFLDEDDRPDHMPDDAADPQEDDLAPAPADAGAWPPTLVEAARRYGDAPEADAVPEFRHHRSENVVRPNATHKADAATQPDEGFQDDLIGGPDLGTDPEDPLNRYLNGAGLIDEDTLREMVRQIVRDELQGKLGERITHNVRKLVRREIHRVLTTQDFD